MRIFDCMTFFNEIDILEFRIKLLSDVVDYFVIVESNLTHSGKPKPYHFEENRHRFQLWSEKIIYIPIEQSTEGLVFDDVKSYSPGSASWILENQQRNGISYIKDIIEGDDLCMISDLDEIVNPEMLKAIRDGEIKVPVEPFSCQQIFHYYFFNCRQISNDSLWNGTVITSGRNFKDNTPQYFRDNRNHFKLIFNAGWHWSYLGTASKIKEKIQSFAHTEFNRDDITSDENIIQSIEQGKDVFNRPGVSYQFVPITEYPAYMQKLMIEYPQFVKQL